MHHLVACILCGGIDPANDQLLLQAVIAGGITTPWVLRSKLRALIDRVRGNRRSGDAYDLACPMPDAEDAGPPASA